MSTRADSRRAILDALKKLGWASRGGVAALKGTDALLVVSFQKSQYESLYFVNVGLWLLALGEPEGFPPHNKCHLQFRIERLFPELSSLLEQSGEGAGEVEATLLADGARLQQLTDLENLRRLYRGGSLSGGLISKEARALLG